MPPITTLLYAQIHTRLPFNFSPVTLNYNPFGSKDFHVKIIGSAFTVIENTFIKYTCG